MTKPSKDYHIEIPESIIEDLLTESEVRMVKQRIFIIQLLVEGLSVRSIAEKAGVGTDTVVRVSKKLNASQALKDVFKRLESEPTVGSSQWIFGQSKLK